MTMTEWQAQINGMATEFDARLAALEAEVADQRRALGELAARVDEVTRLLDEVDDNVVVVSDALRAHERGDEDAPRGAP